MPATTPTLVGLDIGGTKSAVSVPDGDDRVREVARFATAGPVETLARFFDVISSLERGSNPVFGVSCGSPLDLERGMIMAPANLPTWDRVPICDELRARFGGRAFLMNDANAGALAETWWGAARGCRNVIFITMGTGLGSGFVLDGRLYEGTTGNAGEIGHWRLSDDGPVGIGKRGSFEGWCSGGGIARLARERLAHSAQPSALRAIPTERLTTRDLAEAASAGDEFAQRLWCEVGERLGQGLALLIDCLDPECIVIGGVFMRSAHLVVPSMQAVIARECLPANAGACRIVPAALGETTGSYAAIAVARHHLKLPAP